MKYSGGISGALLASDGPASQPINAAEKASVRGASVVVLVLMTWYSIRLLFPLPAIYSHIPTTLLLLSLLFFLVLRRGRLHLTSLQLCIVISLALLMSESLAFHGTTEVLFVGSYLGGLLAYSVIFANRNVSLASIQIFATAVVIPEFLLSVGVLGPQPGMPDGNVPTLIPQSVNGWRISIAPWGNTIHFTAELGALLLMNFLLNRNKATKWRGLLFLTAGVYLLCFAGSRITYISALLTLTLYAINRKRTRPLVSAVLIIVMIGSIYGADAISGSLPKFGGITGSLTKMTADNDDLSSFRGWLWEYHLLVFSVHPLTGSGEEAVRFKIGDDVEGETAPSATESFYTADLAAYGVLGLLFPLIHIGILWEAFRRRNLGAILLASQVLILTAGNSAYATIYGAFQPLVFASLAPCIGGCCEYGAPTKVKDTNSLRTLRFLRRGGRSSPNGLQPTPPSYRSYV